MCLFLNFQGVLYMKTIHYLSSLILCFPLSCGSARNGDSNKDPKPKPTDNSDDTKDGDKEENENSGDNEASTEWYGTVTQCLVDSAEITLTVDDENYVTTEQTVKCSPIVKGKDVSEVTQKLNQWKDLNCPGNDVVPVRNGTPGNYQGVSIKPRGAVNYASNNIESVKNALSDPEYCKSSRKNLYGSLQYPEPGMF
jgi:hypothetical protein